MYIQTFGAIKLQPPDLFKFILIKLRSIKSSILDLWTNFSDQKLRTIEMHTKARLSSRLRPRVRIPNHLSSWNWSPSNRPFAKRFSLGS